jgi:hypothetical protein
MTADEPRHIAPSHFGDDDVFHQPVVTRGPNVPELIEQYRATGKVKQADLADLLAAIGLLYEAFGEDMPSAFRSGNNIDSSRGARHRDSRPDWSMDAAETQRRAARKPSLCRCDAIHCYGKKGFRSGKPRAGWWSRNVRAWLKLQKNLGSTGKRSAKNRCHIGRP